MLNKYYIGGDTTNVKCEVNLNQPSTGFIQKSNPVSRFIRFQRGSKIEGLLFPIDPKMEPRLPYEESRWSENTSKPWESHTVKITKYEEVIVLQVCIFGDDYRLAEYVFKKDVKEDIKE